MRKLHSRKKKCLQRTYHIRGREFSKERENPDGTDQMRERRKSRFPSVSLEEGKIHGSHSEKLVVPQYIRNRGRRKRDMLGTVQPAGENQRRRKASRYQFRVDV